ncbi:MAG: hypothetical protein IJ612_01085 [Prevotella sp.]|nr:hypothetical protein [Prevotella sp.]
MRDFDDIELSSDFSDDVDDIDDADVDVEADVDADLADIDEAFADAGSVSSRPTRAKVYSGYEEACDDGNFEAAHTILNKMKIELRNSISDAQRFYKDNELVKKTGEKVRLFKKNKNIYDTSNREKYEGMIEECLSQAEEYLGAVVYVYDEEMRYVEAEFDKANRAERLEILKQQRETELKYFQHLYLKDTWSRNAFEKIIEKAKEIREEGV